MTNVNLLALLKQADIRSPETLLKHALPKIKQELDAVERIEVFRLARGGLILWDSENSPHENGNFIRIDKQSLYQEAIDQQKTIANDDKTEIVAPLIHQQGIFALLTITFNMQQENTDGLIDDIAQDLGLMLYNQQVQALLQQQIEITGKLSVASSLPDIASIIAQTMTLKGQFIGVNVFEYDDEGIVTGAKILATANRDTSYPTNIPMQINFSALEELRELLINEGEVLVSDVPSEARFSDEARQWLKEQKAQALYLLPMWIDKQLYSFISLVDVSNGLALSNIEKELYQNIAYQAATGIEKQHLLERSQQTASQSVEQARVLRLINNLMALSNRDVDETTIFQEMTDILLATTGADHVGVVIHQGTEAVVISEAPDKGLIGKNIELGSDSVHALLQKTKTALVAQDVATDPDIPEATRKAILDVDILSIVILPMFDENNNILGTISLDYFEKQPVMDSRSIELAQTVVSQVSLSLQKRRLLAESQQQTRQLSQLTEFGQSLRANLTLSNILSLTLQYCPNLMNADYIGVFLYDRQAHGLRANAQHLNGDDSITMDAGIITESQNSIATEAWASHELVKIDDLQNDWDLKHPHQRELQSILALPLSSSGMLLGVLEVGHKNPHFFNATSINALGQVGTQLAIALTNSETYAQSQRVARNKSQANEIIAKLQEQLEVSDILAVTIQELGKAIGAKKGRIRLGTIPEQKGSAK